jgi:hypothetical protein
VKISTNFHKTYRSVLSIVLIVRVGTTTQAELSNGVSRITEALDQ